jgi:hypothetical protein
LLTCRHEPHKFNPNLDALTRQQGLNVVLDTIYMMNTQTEAAEEWLSTKVEALRATFSKAAVASLTLVGPIILSLSGLSTANKVLGSILWVSVILNSLLGAVVCWHRVKNRKRLADLSKTPDLPALDDFDHHMLRYLVAQNLGCGVDRMASDCRKLPFEVSYSMDKLLAWGFVDNSRESTASGAEYRANAKGRDRCINPPKR